MSEDFWTWLLVSFWEPLLYTLYWALLLRFTEIGGLLDPIDD